jgi:methionine salvage enolase-phosphatase E1
LSDLKAKRAEVQKELNELDKQISETQGVKRKKKATLPKKTARGGAVAKRKKKVARKGKGTRAKNTKSAKGYAQEILAKEPKGLTLKELAARVLANGYKSNSDNFTNTLYQSLYASRKAGKIFDFNDKTGCWVLR